MLRSFNLPFVDDGRKEWQEGIVEKPGTVRFILAVSLLVDYCLLKSIVEFQLITSLMVLKSQ